MTKDFRITRHDEGDEWIVELGDSLKPGAVIQVVVSVVPTGFTFQPWRCLYAGPDGDRLEAAISPLAPSFTHYQRVAAEAWFAQFTVPTSKPYKRVV
jgi:hypothetical protein